MKTFKRALLNTLLIIISLALLLRSVVPPADKTESVRAFTRTIEFDFGSWMLDALGIKQRQAALSLPHYMDEKQQKTLVYQCLDLVKEIRSVNSEIEKIYSDSNSASNEEELSPFKLQLNELTSRQNRLAPVCESILQGQVNTVLSSMSFTLGGQAIPPVLYHATPLPYALIVSPRSVIHQDANISLRTDMTLSEMISLEQQVEKGLDVSALVVPIGGIGVYPTMVLNTPHLQSLLEIVSHEWIHNYLNLRPLGLSYEKNSETRTMNETTAAISETEIALNVLKRYYPEAVPPPAVPSEQDQQNPNSAPALPVFDYNAEMHQTRVKTDELLKEGKIIEAENYMESRRQIFLENGYQIRRLNQAYFAFYGAYASEPGGSAGEDPVGPAVRALRDQSRSLVEFVNRISWMTSFDELKKAVNRN